MFILFKYLITAGIIVLVSEVAKRADKVGALIAALPFVTILVMIWLHVENQGSEKIANHAYYTFWYVLPTLPMFLLLPWILRKGVDFWLGLLISVFVTFVSFIITTVLVKRIGVDLMP